MSGLQLSAGDIQNYLNETELPLRGKGNFSKIAPEILRYGSFVGSSVECHSSLSRAMVRGRAYIDSCEENDRSVESGRVILAETLTGSKGRFTRSWHAPQGGLWGCFVHANSLTQQATMLLSLTVGIAACEAFHECGADTAAIRWVNDVLLGEKKVAGFLVESHTGPRWKEQFHLVGFGININNNQFPDELKDIATSLSAHLSEQVSLRRFALCFLAKLVWNIGLLYFVDNRGSDSLMELCGDSHPVIERWKELTDSLGKHVVFGNDVLMQPQYSALVTGIAEDGGLQMVLESGAKITEHSGEIRYL